MLNLQDYTERGATGILLSVLQFFGVKGRIGALRGLFSPLWQGTRLAPSIFGCGIEREGKVAFWPHKHLLRMDLGFYLTQLPKSSEITLHGAVTLRYQITKKKENKGGFLQAQELGLLKLTFPLKFYNVWACIFKHLPQKLSLISRWRI